MGRITQLSVIFIGTGEFGTETLQALADDNRIRIPFVITGQDKPVGRTLQVTQNAIKKAAILNKLIVHQPSSISEMRQKIMQEKPDFLLVVAYGEIIKKDILDLPRYGAVNIHASLLPKYRGATPIQETIRQGDREAGVSWILMNEKMDRGDIIGQEKIGIGERENTKTLSKKLATLAAQKTADVLIRHAESPAALKKQDGKQATYCRKIKKENGRLDFTKESAEEMDRKIRSYTPWPGCFFFWNGKRLKIIEAKAEDENREPGEVHITKNRLFLGTQKGTLEPLIVQPESKRPQGIEEFLRGQKTIPSRIV